MYNIIRKKIEFKQNEILDIVELYKNNFALSSIGKKYSVNRNVIKRILLENNIICFFKKGLI